MGAQIITFLAIFISAVIALAVLVVIIIRIRGGSDFKGKEGEKIINIVLEKASAEVYGHIIHNVIVPDEDGNTSQIDHLFFAQCGVFVIETKNYAGEIYGSENQREWTQVLAYGNTKNKLYNPVMQNKTHVYRLSKVLSTSIKYIPCVVFVQGNISNIHCPGVFTPEELYDFIIEYAKYEINYSSETVDYMYEKILEYKENPVESDKEHVRRIKLQQKAIQNNICPRCGADLVIRTTKDGKSFYGCSNFPECRFKKKI